MRRPCRSNVSAAFEVFLWHPKATLSQNIIYDNAPLPIQAHIPLPIRISTKEALQLLKPRVSFRIRFFLRIEPKAYLSYNLFHYFRQCFYPIIKLINDMFLLLGNSIYIFTTYFAVFVSRIIFIATDAYKFQPSR